MRNWKRYGSALLCLAGPVIAGGCSSDSTGGGNDNVCATELDYESEGGASVQSPAAGVLTFNGQFHTDESVILGYTDNNGGHHSIPITPSTNRTSLSFAGLPSGTRTYTMTISCADGQDHRANGNFTVQ